MAEEPSPAELKAVSSVLESFKAARDWPDFIHSLQSLNGILAAAAGGGGAPIPAKHTVAKRLAQGCGVGCSPSVHAKVLELYGTIFARIGPEQLARDLPLYSLGMLPLLEHAGPEVQPSVLLLLERHYLPLGAQLAPCLPGLVTALTAELSDPGAPLSPRLLSLLVQLGVQAGGREPLCATVWDCLQWSPHTRTGGLRFLLEHSDVTGEWAQARPLAAARARPAVDALCECLGDAELDVQHAAAQLVLQRFPLQACLGDGPEPEASPRDQPACLIASAMLLLLRHDHAELRKTVRTWLQDALPGTAPSGDAAPPACDRAAAAVVAALEALLTDLPEASEAAAWPFDAVLVLVADPSCGRHFLRRICSALLQRLRHESAPETAAGAGARALLVKLSPVAVWAILTERWEDSTSDWAREAQLLETALHLSEAGVLAADEPSTQQNHLPRLLAQVCGQFCVSERPQKGHTLRMLRLGLGLVSVLLDRRHLDDGSHPGGKSQLVVACRRCEGFVLWFVRTFVAIDFSRLHHRISTMGEVTSECNPFDVEPWMLEVFATAFHLMTTLQQKQKPPDDVDTDIGDTEDDVYDVVAPCYRWIDQCASRPDAIRVQSAITAEAAFSPTWLSLLHALDATSADIARDTLRIIVDANSTDLHRQTLSEIMVPASVFGTAIAQRAWDFLPASHQVVSTGTADGHPGFSVRWALEGAASVSLHRWCQLHRAYPLVCSSVLRSILADVETDAPHGATGSDESGTTAARVANIRRFGLLCAVAFESSEDLMDTLDAGVLPMLAACTDESIHIRHSALLWLSWVVSTGLPWLVQVLLPPIILLASPERCDDVQAAYLLGRLCIIAQCDGFLAAASVRPAPSAAVAAARAAGMETSAKTCLQLLGDVALIVTRMSTDRAESVPASTVGASALDCLTEIVSLTRPNKLAVELESAATDLRMRLTEPCLMLLTVCVERSSALQMPLLSLVRTLISAGLQPKDLTLPNDGSIAPTPGLLESAVRKGQLEVSILKGLRHAHPVQSPLLSQWLAFTADVIAALEQTRASTLRIAISALVELLAESAAHHREMIETHSGPPRSDGRTYVLARSLADIVDQHLRGLVDLSAETIPADAFPDLSAAGAAPGVRAVPRGGLWGLVSSAFVEEAEDVPPPPPTVQTGVAILQALPMMITGCVCVWGSPGLHGAEASALAPQRAEVARLLAIVWLARPFALFAGVLQWWLENSDSQSTSASDRQALIEMLHGSGPTAILAGEVLTVGCKVLGQLYAVTRAREAGAPTAAVELKWSGLLSLPVSEVEPGWASLLDAFIEGGADGGSKHALPGQLNIAWPALHTVCHDALHTALVPWHAPIPPALLLLRLLDVFVSNAAAVSEQTERLAWQDLTQRLVGQCLAAVPHSVSTRTAAAGSSVQVEPSTWTSAIAAAKLLGLEEPNGSMLDAAAGNVTTSDSAIEGAAAHAMGLLTLKWLGRALPALCAKVWSGDDERLISTLDGFVAPVIRQLGANEAPALGEAAAVLISAFAENASTLAVWRPSVLAALQRDTLFGSTPATLTALRPTVAAIFKADPSRLPALLTRGPAASSALERASSFSFKRSTDALLERAASLRRITYALWCGAIGQHRSAIRSAILEAVGEALQAVEQDESSNGVDEGASILLSSVFLCMRAIALRIAERNLAPFWPLATAELLRVLSKDTEHTENFLRVLSTRSIRNLAPFWPLATSELLRVLAQNTEHTQHTQNLLSVMNK